MHRSFGLSVLMWQQKPLLSLSQNTEIMFCVNTPLVSHSSLNSPPAGLCFL